MRFMGLNESISQGWEAFLGLKVAALGMFWSYHFLRRKTMSASKLAAFLQADSRFTKRTLGAIHAKAGLTPEQVLRAIAENGGGFKLSTGRKTGNVYVSLA